MTAKTMTREIAEAIVSDRWDTATVTPVIDASREGVSEIESSDLWGRLDLALTEFGARLAGGEVLEGDGLHDALYGDGGCVELVAQRLKSWAVDLVVARHGAA